ncbi:cleavage and polyadenylation specificity factor subunit 1-like isoform X5 [Andrographis paniculata]|uniref:cleavage and polyadenylation specificity factor subunit 1-like isoform X5 n=1 Tax=Andrographis paniculata TaxID=175694 RepID=UPI0021E7EB9F|nr:cleavage and polyadenylation specificity factor subunit 1-like isoform X5 [Andrographis paniculata]XP_051121800.1 cleavage and polyadenylation specificity factor subunit 1-like isoform X5 [Andrographis paniculata]
MHCFEGPDWLHLKRGRECFPRGPLVKVDPLGRCAAVLVYGLQLIVLKAAEASSGLVGEDSSLNAGPATASRIESSYIVGLRDLDMKHVKDFIFLNGAYMGRSCLMETSHVYDICTQHQYNSKAASTHMVGNQSSS